ncbi:rRNA maturation RNase YbeY [Marinospirillum alkaliphilum]|uniref:Endoribonuclease YbeY n=1 Tax=Marinospirillum alkaliphilum DSM 21637 TaxID=1122209 RepID=A0A1K1TDP7_9GAMM|nr:rRNA maturation RNase YbeY [Marinospirillum alkaliphilum]SFW98686.1 probable rRNA maturation factor [Marinospirillum alkaliphilum DSM 21637]
MTTETPSLWVDLQLATEQPDACPDESLFNRWASLALQSDAPEQAEVTIRIVDDAESRQLNHDYRGKDKPTNVLSFPFESPIDLPPEAELSLLGDLVICLPQVLREATEQGKPPLHHWAHLVIHGMLHLQGFDHEQEHQAEVMERLEVALLQQLGIPDPYADNPVSNDVQVNP